MPRKNSSRKLTRAQKKAAQLADEDQMFSPAHSSIPDEAEEELEVQEAPSGLKSLPYDSEINFFSASMEF